MIDVIGIVAITTLALFALLIFIFKKRRRIQHAYDIQRTDDIQHNNHLSYALRQLKQNLSGIDPFLTQVRPYFSETLSQQLEDDMALLNVTTTSLNDRIDEAPRTIDPTVLDRLIDAAESLLTYDQINNNPGSYLAHQYFLDIKPRIDAHCAQRAIVSKRRDQLQAQQTTTINDLAADLHRKLSSAKGIVDSAPTRHGHAQKLIDTRRNELESAKRKRETLRSEADDLTRKANELSRQATDLQPELNELSRKKGNEDGHISNLEVRIARNKTNIGHISQRRETYSAESARKVADLERKAAALQNELNVSVESNYSDEHIKALEKHLESTKIQIADTIRSNDQSIGNLTLEITDLTNEIGIFEQRLASHSHEADILHTEFRRIHARQQELVGQADSKLTISASKRSHGERAVEKAQEAVSNAQTKLAQEQKRTEEARKRVNILPNQIKRIRSSSADDALRFAHGKVSSTVWSQLFQALEQAGQSMRGAIHKRMDLTKELYPYVMHLWHLSSAAVALQNQYADLAFLDLLTDTNERAHPLTKEALALTDKVRTINHRANQRVREIERTQQALTSTIDHALKANAFEELKPAIEQVCETMEQLKVLRSDHTDDARAAQKELEVLARVLSDVEEIVEGPKEVLSRFNSGIKGLTGAPEKVATIGIATKKLLSVAKDERLQHAIDAYSSPAYTDTIEGIDRVIELLQDQLSGAVMQAVDQRDPTEVSNGHTDVPTDDIPAGGDSAKAKTTRKKVVTVTIMLIVIVGLLGALALAFARVQASPSSNVDAPTTTPLASLVPITTTTTTLTTTTVGGRTESPITNTEESRPKNAASATTSRDTTAISIPGNPGDTVNCGDFASWKEAQDWFDTYAPHYGDVAFMDINDNGVACEKLLPEGVNVAEVLDRQRVGGDVDPSPPSDGGEPTVEDGGQGGP